MLQNCSTWLLKKIGATVDSPKQDLKGAKTEWHKNSSKLFWHWNAPWKVFLYDKQDSKDAFKCKSFKCVVKIGKKSLLQFSRFSCQALTGTVYDLVASSVTRPEKDLFSVSHLDTFQKSNLAHMERINTRIWGLCSKKNKTASLTFKHDTPINSNLDRTESHGRFWFFSYQTKVQQWKL